jgi:hypothetical protein
MANMRLPRQAGVGASSDLTAIGNKVLVHLHPDFSPELEAVLKAWNESQTIKHFFGLRPSRELEKRLLTGGAISLEDGITLGAQIRTMAGFAPDDEVLIFTEKRLFAPPYYQLYFGGSESEELHPSVDIVSLDFTRKFFNEIQRDKKFVFQAILLNILNAQAQRAGLDTHVETRGCILDFCDNMPDILVGLERGPTFCEADSRRIQLLGAQYLFDLAAVVQERKEHVDDDQDIATRILSVDKPRLIESESAFDYDVALSFAGEDRRYAEELATTLHERGIRVFYDAFQKAALWGEDLYVYLTDLYRLRSKYCIMFLSRHYANKLWTSHERQAAQSRAFRENKAYILPIRLDQTEIPGILDTIGYLNWSEEGCRGIAQCVVEKLSNARYPSKQPHP